MNIIRNILLFTSIVQVSCNSVDREEIRSIIREGGNIRRSAEHEEIINERHRNCEGEYEYSCYSKVLKNFSKFSDKLMYFVGEIKTVIKNCMDESNEAEKNNFIEAVREWLSQIETEFKEKHHSNSYNVIWRKVVHKQNQYDIFFDVKAASDIMRHLINECNVISECLREFPKSCEEYYTRSHHIVLLNQFNSIMKNTDNTMKRLNINSFSSIIMLTPHRDSSTSIGVEYDQEPAISYNEYHRFKGNLTGEKYDDFQIYRRNWELYRGNAEKTVEYATPLIATNQNNIHNGNYLDASFRIGTCQTYLIWLWSVYDNYPLASSCVIGATVCSSLVIGVYVLVRGCCEKSHKKRRGYKPPKEYI